MADSNTFFQFKDASFKVTRDVENLLLHAVICVDIRDKESPQGSPVHFPQVKTAIDKALKKCFELGVIYLRLAHGVISYLTGLHKLTVAGVHSRYLLVAQEIEAMGTLCTELLQAVKVVEEAWEFHNDRSYSRSAILFYIRRFGKGLNSDDTTRVNVSKLAQLWCSSYLEIVTPGSTHEVVASYQKNIIRICLYGLPLRKHYETSSGVLYSPLMDNLLPKGVDGAEHSFGILVEYAKQLTEGSIDGTLFKRDTMEGLFNYSILSALSHLTSSLFSGLSNEASASLTELTASYAKIFESLVVYSSSLFEIENCLHRLKDLDIFISDQDPFMFFQDVPMHWENLRRAFENTRSNWDIVVPLLERLLEDPTIENWNHITVDSSPGDLKCIKCTIENLLEYCGILSMVALCSSKRSREIREPVVGNTFLENFRTLYLHQDGGREVQPLPEAFRASTKNQTPYSPIESHPEDLQLFWSNLLAASDSLRATIKPFASRRSPSPELDSVPTKLSFQWRPCTSKEQNNYSRASGRVKHLWKAKSTISTTTIPIFQVPLPYLPIIPPDQGVSTAPERRRDMRSFQGDWSF